MVRDVSWPRMAVISRCGAEIAVNWRSVAPMSTKKRGKDDGGPVLQPARRADPDHLTRDEAEIEATRINQDALSGCSCGRGDGCDACLPCHTGARRSVR